MTTLRAAAELISDVRRALDADEIVVHYQPIVGSPIARSGRRGASSLAASRVGLLAPGAFIPTVEQTALIGPLTARVLEQAIAQCAIWHDAGRDLTVSVNLSVRNLLDRTYPARSRRCWWPDHLDPSALQLEITESVIMSDPDRVLATVFAPELARRADLRR